MADEQAELESFTVQLRAARRRLRISQEEFGAGLGVSALAIGSWEQGKDIPAVGNFVRWCEGLGYSVGVAGFSPDTVLVPRADELFEEFHIRRVTRGLAEEGSRSSRWGTRLGSRRGRSTCTKPRTVSRACCGLSPGAQSSDVV
jgi:transcriptional regulator with XRE-family HTH domain